MTKTAETAEDGQQASALTAASSSGEPRRASDVKSSTPRREGGGQGAEILEVTEKHGTLYNSIPCMPLPLAIICCIFNIVVPGLGTFISAWTTLCGCKTKLGAPAKAFGLNLLSAFLQMVTFILIVGWVWSIIWGMNFVQIATASRGAKKRDHSSRDLE